jgi:hypothetical protein
MAGSLRLTQGNQTPYRNPAISAAVGREAHHEQSGGARPTRVNADVTSVDSRVAGIREAQSETRVSAMPREAHLETAAAAIPRRTVSVAGLQRLGALLERDENLARKLAKNPRRALASVDFISERDKDVLAGIDPQLWNQIAAVSDNFQVAVGERALAGLPDVASSASDFGAGYDPAAGGGYGWGGVGPPSGRGIDVGGGLTAHPRGHGGAPPGGEGRPDWGGQLPTGGGPMDPFGSVSIDPGNPITPPTHGGGGAAGRGGGVGAGDGRGRFTGASPGTVTRESSPTSGTGGVPESIRYRGDYEPEVDPEKWEAEFIKGDPTITGGWTPVTSPSDKPVIEGNEAPGNTQGRVNDWIWLWNTPPAIDPDKHNNPNPDDPGTSGPGSPRAVSAAIGRPGADLTPNWEGAGAPKSGGPRGVYGRGGREAVPNTEGTGGIGPIGPRSRVAFRSIGNEAMPDPDRGGPQNPHT